MKTSDSTRTSEESSNGALRALLRLQKKMERPDCLPAKSSRIGSREKVRFEP